VPSRLSASSDKQTGSEAKDRWRGGSRLVASDF